MRAVQVAPAARIGKGGGGIGGVVNELAEARSESIQSSVMERANLQLDRREPRPSLSLSTSGDTLYSPPNNNNHSYCHCQGSD